MDREVRCGSVSGERGYRPSDPTPRIALHWGDGVDFTTQEIGRHDGQCLGLALLWHFPRLAGNQPEHVKRYREAH
jgi:hypothetical protein